MRPTTYRLLVIGTMLSSFLVGLHVPSFHDMIEHGAAPQREVVTATLLLAVGAVIGTWRLLRTVPAFSGGDRS